MACLNAFMSATAQNVEHVRRNARRISTVGEGEQN